MAKSTARKEQTFTVQVSVLGIDSNWEPATLAAYQYREKYVYPHIASSGYSIDKCQGPMAKRIYAATQKAGLRKIDHMVISHFHGDHTGGLAALSKMIPIEKFYDHGGAVDAVDQGRLDQYKAVAGNKRNVVKPGDVIDMAGVRVTVVTANTNMLANPLPGGGPNALCENAPQMSPAGGENQRGVSVVSCCQP